MDQHRNDIPEPHDGIYMSYPGDLPRPAGGPQKAPRPTYLPVLLAVGAVALIAGIAFTLIALTSDGEPAPGPVASQPISRTELMAKYADINPIDRSATPETMDALATSTCDALGKGITTDRIITVATDQYASKATAVIRLLVSYRCPERLADFK